MGKLSLIDFLNKVGKNLSMDFRSINQGGCCVVAGYLALFLRHKADDVKVVVQSYGCPPLDEVRKETNNSMARADWYSQGCTFQHVLVQFSYEGVSYLLDSSGCHLLHGNDKGIAEGYLTIPETITFGKESQGWNPYFDRDQIPDMKKAITRYFRHPEILQAA